jgi:GNAT superfamily N-acetyltransferase
MIGFILAVHLLASPIHKSCELEFEMENDKNSVSEQEQLAALRRHFLLFYQMLAESHVIPQAAFQEGKGMQRGFSGIQDRYHNMIMGRPSFEGQWDQYIEEQMDFFKQEGVPFVWYVNEDVSQKFKEKLFAHGFKEGGVFRGVVGVLDHPIPSPEIPVGCTLEPVQDIGAMGEWTDLVCTTFGMEKIKDTYKQVMWKAATQSKMFHWVARKEGKVVSALSTMIDGNTVSFWNGATLPDMRKQGLSSAIRRLALQHAVARGCRIGTSYLMSEGLAYGICRKLGYETKWRFNVFLLD